MLAPNLTQPTFVAPTKEQDQAQFDANIDAIIAFFQVFHPEAIELISWFTEVRNNISSGLTVNGLTPELRENLAGYVIGISDLAGNPLEPVQIDTIEEATTAQAQAGTDDLNYMTALKTRFAIATFRPFATPAEVATGTSTSVVVSPARLNDAIIAGAVQGASKIGDKAEINALIFATTRPNGGSSVAQVNYGDILPGSTIYPCSACLTNFGSDTNAASPDAAVGVGTWKCLGYISASNNALGTLFQRVT